jgi:hypothetical protein
LKLGPGVLYGSINKMLELGVLSAKLRSGAGERVLLEEIALRDPVMPVPDGLIR